MPAPGRERAASDRGGRAARHAAPRRVPSHPDRGLQGGHRGLGAPSRPRRQRLVRPAHRPARLGARGAYPELQRAAAALPGARPRRARRLRPGATHAVGCRRSARARQPHGGRDRQREGVRRDRAPAATAPARERVPPGGRHVARRLHDDRRVEPRHLSREAPDRSRRPDGRHRSRFGRVGDRARSSLRRRFTGGAVAPARRSSA